MALESTDGQMVQFLREISKTICATETEDFCGQTVKVTRGNTKKITGQGKVLTLDLTVITTMGIFYSARDTDLVFFGHHLALYTKASG